MQEALAKGGATPATPAASSIGHKKREATLKDEKVKENLDKMKKGEDPGPAPVSALGNIAPAEPKTMGPSKKEERKAKKEAERAARKAKREAESAAKKAEREAKKTERENRKKARSEALVGLEGVPVAGPDWRVWITVKLEAMDKQMAELKKLLQDATMGIRGEIAATTKK